MTILSLPLRSQSTKEGDIHELRRMMTMIDILKFAVVDSEIDMKQFRASFEDAAGKKRKSSTNR